MVSLYIYIYKRETASTRRLGNSRTLPSGTREYPQVAYHHPVNPPHLLVYSHRGATPDLIQQKHNRKKYRIDDKLNYLDELLMMFEYRIEACIRNAFRQKFVSRMIFADVYLEDTTIR